MFISITSGPATKGQLKQLEEFLKTFLPRMRQLPGVMEIYYYSRPDQGDSRTVVIWESEAAFKNYQESDLLKEVLAFQKEHNLPGTREGYPITFAL